MTDQQLAAIPFHSTALGFSDLEKLVMDYAEAMTTTPQQVDDALFGRLRERLDPRQMVELTAIIAWENYRARFNHAFGLASSGIHS